MSPAQGIHDQATLAAAIANFKPTSREVISGIAPHVFDDRRMRRRRNSTGRLPKRRPSMGFHCESYPRTSAETPSPLRISAIVTVEEVMQMTKGVEEDILNVTVRPDKDPQSVRSPDVPCPPEKARKSKHIFTIIRIKALATKFRTPRL